MIGGLSVTTRSLRRRSPAFTLVELLVVISIIALLAGIILTAMAGVQETARVNRTRAQIAQINALLMEKWEEYKTRRVPDVMSFAEYQALKPRDRSYRRLLALRELMRLELPDRYTDIQDPPVFTSMGVGLRNVFRDSYLRAIEARTGIKEGGDFGPLRTNQQAEILYLILSQIHDGDTSALTFFRDTEIRDTDGDNMPEIVDAWGTPIRWLRWAPGYVSNLQPEDPDERSLDQFDPALSDWRYDPTIANPTGIVPFEMYPVIVSAGPDKQFDLVMDDLENNGGKPLSYSAVNNDPYAFPNVGRVNITLGDPPNTVDESGDNIDNHSLVAR